MSARPAHVLSVPHVRPVVPAAPESAIVLRDRSSSSESLLASMQGVRTEPLEHDVDVDVAMLWD